jgi:hypothetical protein
MNDGRSIPDLVARLQDIMAGIERQVLHELGVSLQTHTHRLSGCASSLARANDCISNSKPVCTELLARITH